MGPAVPGEGSALTTDEQPITRQARAKINVTFEVLGRRRDGYHEVVTIMQAISLCDVISFEADQDLILRCDVAELVSPHNLAFRAARLMQAAAGARRGVAISIWKGIPLAGGLGGGSSDAAQTLVALNRMWEVGLTPAGLMAMAARLGSDVPFFVSGRPTALATGRGQRVTALASPGRTWLVLLRPPLELAHKTREMYSRLRPELFTGGEHAERLRATMGRGERVSNSQCFNAFEALAPSAFPGMDGYRRRFLEAGASQVHLAGAGPTLFSLVSGRDEGDRIARRLRRQGLQAWLAETL